MILTYPLTCLQVLDAFGRFTSVVWPALFVALLRALDLSALLGIRVYPRRASNPGRAPCSFI